MINKTQHRAKSLRKKPGSRSTSPQNHRKKRFPPGVLDVEDLQLYRGKTSILRDLNWRIHQGEHWAVLGPNGSGKTSLLNILLGYQMASSGKVRLLGREFG